MAKPDATEQRIPDSNTAREMLLGRDPEFLTLTDRLLAQLQEQFPASKGLLTCLEKALLVAYARMAARHGSWGNDFHAYHNEQHAREILEDRLPKVGFATASSELNVVDSVLLALFAVTHDLRQRASAGSTGLIGPNERASQGEAQRILLSSGFDLEEHGEIFESLSLMIAGSTFIADPTQSSCGATAAQVINNLPDANPERRQNQLILLAADIDTANVADPFLHFAQGAVRLFTELEMRQGRELLTVDSAAAAFDFLTIQQEAYFFKLQRFDSHLGKRAFAAAKGSNEPRLRECTKRMRSHFTGRSMANLTGQQVVDSFLQLAQQVA